MTLMNRLSPEHDYYEWLTSQIATPNNQKTYHELFNRLHNLEFIWTVPGDHDREVDGADLRVDFFNETHRKVNLGGVTILEVLIALSRRTAFTAGGDARVWVWKFLKNLRLNKMSDPWNEHMATRVDDILYAFVWRTYDPSGQGGLFPLRNAEKDQTKVNIWYQMNTYVIERDGL